MTRLARVLGLFMIFLAVPSTVWVLTRPFLPTSEEPIWRSQDWWLGWSAELLFVLCCLGIAVAAWKRLRLWPYALLAFSAYESFVLVGPMLRPVLLVAPMTYVNAVLGEAAERGITHGPSLIWSLLVLPLVFPALFILAASLCIVARRPHSAG